MKLEHSCAGKTRKQILAVIGKHLDLKKYRVFVFGSRVAGINSEGSDIDIGIEGPKKLPLEVLATIRGEMEELPTLYMIDVVDFKSAVAGFRKEASKNREFLTAIKNG